MRVFYLFSSLRGLAMGLFLPIWILYLADCGFDLLTIGLLGTVFEVAKLIFEIPSGTFADRFGVKLSITGSLLFSALTWALFPLSDTFIICLIAMVTWALSDALISGSFQTWMSRETGTEQFGKEMMKNTQVMIIFTTSSSIASGFLYSANQILPFILTASVYIFWYLWSLFYIRVPEVKEDEPYDSQETFFQILTRSLTLILNKRRVMLIVIAGFFSALTYDTIARYWQPYLETIGFSPKTLGLVMAFAGLCTFILLTLMLKVEQMIDRKSMTVLTIIETSGMILTGLLAIGVKPIGLASTSILLAIEDVREPVVYHYLNQLFPDQYKTTLFSVHSGVGAAGEILSGVIFGVIAVKFGLATTFIVAAICLLPCIIMYIVVPGMKEQEAVQLDSVQIKENK
ncbi:MFS transporter [Bacillus changyiensis]|uniref:MFS transporter n=1 Tax=Bacillus changyiensis TaxID=3004103 RepID=UPI0022E72D3E|nr:MFS transporter [Bacillus changyiensis]MDA1478077.1 MFS transporter [Bacillus changyiensis]